MAKLTNHLQQIRLITPLTDKHYSLDSEDDLCSGCRNVSHQKQIFSDPPSPGWSHITNFWYSWVQTIQNMSLNQKQRPTKHGMDQVWWPFTIKLVILAVETHFSGHYHCGEVKEAGNSFQHFSNSYTLKGEHSHCLTSDATIMVSGFVLFLELKLQGLFKDIPGRNSNFSSTPSSKKCHENVTLDYWV